MVKTSTGTRNRLALRSFLLFLILTTVIAGLGLPAHAAGNDYPWQSSNPSTLSPLGFNFRNCTDFAAWRLNTQRGTTSAPWRFKHSNLASPSGNGHAIGWKDGAISRGYRVDDIPAIGAVAWWGSSRGGGLGHVAIVTGVNADGSANIEQYNAVPYAYSTQNGIRAEKYLHIADRGNRDVNGDGRADLVIVGAGPTGSGKTEVHALDGATGYSTWLGHWATAAGYSNGAGDRHVLGDVNGDGRSDLVIVGTGPTGSGRLEAHVLDGATGYSTWLAHWATAAGYTGPNDRILIGDVNGDGRGDLVIVGTGPTGSGQTEAHVLDAATGYSTWLAHWATAAGYSNSAGVQHVMGDANGDGRADLVIVGTGPTGSGKTEVHALDGATGYSTWLGHWATAAGYSNGAGDQHVMGDVNGDGRADLVIVGTGPTGSGRLEAHVLDGATGYSTWLAHWATAAGYTGPNERILM